MQKVYSHASLVYEASDYRGSMFHRQIVLHLLCVYLDSHLPLSPLFTNGRPFTSHYLIKSPDKPGIYIYVCTLSLFPILHLCGRLVYYSKSIGDILCWW